MKVYSGNAKTFLAAAKWLRQVIKNKKFNDFLAKMLIRWQFNMIWAELKDVNLDVGSNLNN